MARGRLAHCPTPGPDIPLPLNLSSWRSPHPQPSEQKFAFDCIQRQIVFSSWTRSLQQQSILIIFAGSEQRYFAIAAGPDVRLSEGQRAG